jgi:hypothetical protein
VPSLCFAPAMPRRNDDDDFVMSEDDTVSLDVSYDVEDEDLDYSYAL